MANRRLQSFKAVSRESKRLFGHLAQPPLRWLREAAAHPLVLHGVLWTVLLAASVTLISTTLELGFSGFISRSHAKFSSPSAMHNNCQSSCGRCFGLPLDRPSDGLCVPAHLLGRSILDFVVPPIFAGVVVAASAGLVHNLGIWN